MRGRQGLHGSLLSPVAVAMRGLQRLEGIEESATFTELAELLLDQALLAEGQLPSDPAATARRLNRLLQERADQS